MKQMHLIVSGKVQGVFFRDYVKKTAESLGLKGWVRNNSSGTVEAVAEGNEETLKKLLEKCKEGPSAARVEDISVDWKEGTGEFREFLIIFK
ncbi:acylphosphatase [Candidatus Woesearchaeota archaeon]|nr:acylphosphatase [Candidatus Woesearchaeota archaeon]